MDVNNLLLIAIKASVLAGDEILEVYDSDFAIETKEDKSPLTLADKNANKLIISILNESAIPILSEEGRDIPYKERKQWDYFWLVDPLDGTKEFIKRNGEFTVNIALIKDQRPILGVIYVPVYKTLFFANEDAAYKMEGADSLRSGQYTLESLAKESKKLPYIEKNDTFNVVASRSHMSKETEEFIDTLRPEHPGLNIVSSGSSLKLCMVAEGKADIYPRFAPTMEWDTGAGQAIVLGSGGKVTETNQKDPLLYNKENLLNPWFIVSR